MTRRYYHLIWAAAFSGGLMLCKVKGIYSWFDSWGYILLTAIIVLSLIFNFIFLSVRRSFEEARCSHKKFFPVLLCLYGLIFIMLGTFCGARLQVCNFNKLDEKLKLILQNNGNASIVLNGRVSSHPKSSRGSLGFKVDAAFISVVDDSSQANITLENAGEVDVILRNYYGNGLERDEQVILKGNYRKGQYNGYILAYSNGFEKIKKYHSFGWLYIFRKAVYKCIRNTIYKTLDYRQAAICEAAVLGNSANINEGQAKDFINSGIYHLLAISGLHISFFVILAKAITSGFFKSISINRARIRTKNNLSVILILAVLLLYNFVIGEKASVLRATVMSVFILLSANWGKAIDKKAVLSFTFIILLVINPLFFIEASFWLSFLSVAAITYLNDIISGLFGYLKKKIFQIIKPAVMVSTVKNSHIKKHGYFASIFISSLSVNLFIFPVIMYLFGSTGIFGIILNIAAVPVFYTALFILIIASFAAIIWPPVGSFLLKPVFVPLYILIRLSQAWKISGASIIRIDEFSPNYVILYYIILCGLSFAASRFLNKRHLSVCD